MLLDVLRFNMDAAVAWGRVKTGSSKEVIVRFAPTVIGYGPVQFAGSLPEALRYVGRQSALDRAELMIETRERAYSADEIEALHAWTKRTNEG